MLDAERFYRKWIGDISDCQDRITGHVQYTAPYTTCGGGPGGWGCAIVVVPYTFYRQYGDPQPMAELYPQMLRYFDYLEAHSPVSYTHLVAEQTSQLLPEGRPGKCRTASAAIIPKNSRWVPEACRKRQWFSNFAIPQRPSKNPPPKAIPKAGSGCSKIEVTVPERPSSPNTENTGRPGNRRIAPASPPANATTR